MKHLKTRLLRSLIVAAAALLLLPGYAMAQRDYFTPEEVELIRDAQEIDKRIDVLIHAIDRRFEVLKSDVAAPIVSAKDAAKWGELPKGTRAEMLFDIKRILRKAIDDIDSLAERPESAVISPNSDPKKVQSLDKIFPKAVRNLAKAADRYRPVLRAELDRTTSNQEKGSIMDTIDMCDEVIAAVPKLANGLPKKAGT